MPQFASCPICGRRARVPGSLVGGRVKCRGCATTFTATPNDPASREQAGGDGEDIEIVDDASTGYFVAEDEDDRPARAVRRPREEDDQVVRSRMRKKKRHRAQGDERRLGTGYRAGSGRNYGEGT